MHKLNVNCLLNKGNVNRCLLETLGSELSVGLIGFTLEEKEEQKKNRK